MFFIIFKGFSFAKNCLRRESVPSNTYLIKLLIWRKYILFWTDLSVFSYWTPWMLKAKVRVVRSLNILYSLL